MPIVTASAGGGTCTNFPSTRQWFYSNILIGSSADLRTMILSSISAIIPGPLTASSSTSRSLGAWSRFGGSLLSRRAAHLLIAWKVLRN